VNDANVMQIGMDAMVLATKMAAPTLMTALVVGVLVGLVQSATQLQEATLSFVPKFAAVGIALLLTGNWMLAQMIDFTRELWSGVPTLLT
jgi:flagellar biosynthetic protein FliQ